MSNLNEKQKALHKSGLNLFEKKMLRQALGSLGAIALHLDCPIDGCIINISIPEDGAREVAIVISNHVNGNTADATHTADELRDQHPLFVDLFDKLMKIIRECAEFWKTEDSNIVFQVWSEENTQKLISIVKPRTGFPESEKMHL